MGTVGSAATRNEKEVRKEYPVEEGLTAGTTKQTGRRYLRAEQGSMVSRREKLGFS